MNKFFKRLAVFACFMGVFVFAHSAFADEAKDERIKQFLKMLVEDDLLYYLTNPESEKDTMFIPNNTPRIQHKVTVKELEKEFEDNELRAEKKYNSLFEVTGKIVGVKRDAVGRAYVEFASSKMGFTNLEAYLSLYGIEQASDYDKGKTVTLRCKSAQKSMVVKLDRCQEPSDAKEKAKQLSDEIVVKFLNNESVSNLVVGRNNTPASNALFYMWYVAKNYDLKDACLSTKTVITPSCGNLGKLKNDPQGQEKFTKALEEYQKTHRLP